MSTIRSKPLSQTMKDNAPAAGEQWSRGEIDALAAQNRPPLAFVTRKTKPLSREAQARQKTEGPDPGGVATRLRRERDEAREERDRAELELSHLRSAAQEYWLIIRGVAEALRLPYGGTLTLPVEDAQKLYALYADGTGDYEDMPIWFVLPPDD